MAEENEMNVLIVGSRNIDNIDITPHIPNDVTHIISGGAKGVDTFAEQYADKHKISKSIFRPRYDLYKRCAPLKRNDKMVDICDKVIAFWDGKSRGTKHTIDYARKAGKDVDVIIIKA